MKRESNKQQQKINCIQLGKVLPPQDFSQKSQKLNIAHFSNASSIK